MRGIAKKKGYMLNQNGLYKNGKLITINSEKEIYDLLGIPYVKPKDR